METTTNKGQIFIIVCTIAFLATACVLTNCYLAYVGKEPPQAFTLLTGGLVGTISAMLVKTSPTETAKPPPSQPSAMTNDVQPAPVIVANTQDNPVPTEEKP